MSGRVAVRVLRRVVRVRELRKRRENTARRADNLRQEVKCKFSVGRRGVFTKQRSFESQVRICFVAVETQIT